jgi:hypothetical protein
MKTNRLNNILLFGLVLGTVIYIFVNFFLTIKEGLVDLGKSATSHTVNLPFNSSYRCNNFCGPKARCAITGEQCSTDVDCYGCQPPLCKQPIYPPGFIDGNNEAGKLTYNQPPQYSSLTTDIGTKATVISDKHVPRPYEGVNTWRESADLAMEMYEKKYWYQYSSSPDIIKNMPQYPVTDSITGIYKDYGPPGSNSTL